MAFSGSSYHLHVRCMTAYDGSSSAITGIARCKDLQLDMQRRPIITRCDHSYIPTVLDVVHEGWRWSLRHRDPVQAAVWLRQKYLGSATFRAYSPNASTYGDVSLHGCVIDTMNWGGAWRELADWTIGGWCSLVKFDGTAVENMSLRSVRWADNLAFEGDTVNQWDSGGI